MGIKLRKHYVPLQNIPVRSELGKQIRKSFFGAPSKALVNCDYSGLEMRLAALLSK